MKKIKFFDLIEKSFKDLKKTNKKIWIIGVILAVVSGGLITDNENSYYEETIYNTTDAIEVESTQAVTGYEYISESLTQDILIIVLAAIIILLIIVVVLLLVSVISYYLYNSIYDAIFNTNLEKASLGLVVKVNFIVGIKIILGFILFIIPGIIMSVKYAPTNYVLCKNPHLTSKEILSKTRELSKGFKWKIFGYNIGLSILYAIISVAVSMSIGLTTYSVFILILNMIITLALTTFMSVYESLFCVNLYKDIDDLKTPIAVE